MLQNLVKLFSGVLQGSHSLCPIPLHTDIICISNIPNVHLINSDNTKAVTIMGSLLWLALGKIYLKMKIVAVPFYVVGKIRHAHTRNQYSERRSESRETREFFLRDVLYQSSTSNLRKGIISKALRKLTTEQR